MPKSKSKSKVRARAAPGRKRPVAPSDAVVDFYMGRSDAFRLPDAETAPSGLMRMVSDSTVTSNVNGDAVIGFLPRLDLDTMNNTVTTGNLGSTWTATAHPQTTTLTGNSYRSRMTGWRITICYNGPEQTASGTMWVGTGAQFNVNVISAPMTQFTPMMREVTLKAGTEYVMYAPMFAEPNYEIPGSNWNTNYWNGVLLFFRGLPASTQCLQIRTVRSVEYIPEITSSPLVELEVEPLDPVMLNEAGVLSGSAQLEGDDQGPSWAATVGRAVYGVVKGATRAIVEDAKQDLRHHLRTRRMPMLEF